MKLIRRIYTYYAFLIFVLFFLIAFPFFLIPIIFPSQFRLTGVINRWWAYCVFTLIFLPWKVESKSKLDPKKQYIFCPNHFSYLDIPAMGLNPINSIFVGKSDMENVPLFGFMYRKLHITVNRLSLKSRFQTILDSLKAIDDGKSLMIFPEGGIITKHQLTMVKFKDGAFRTAIEKQIPIVPVTLPNNWIILPDEEPLLLRWGTVKVILHEPIETNGMTLDDVDSLKQKVYQVIDTELKHENRSSNAG